MKYTKYIILFTIFYIIYYFFSRFVKKSIIIEGVKDKNIYFGQTFNFRNPDAKALSNGIMLAFYTENKKGGVHGNFINLQIYDDEYKPEKAIDNSKLLVDYQNVLALIGTWGTTIINSIYYNVIIDRDTPLIGTYTADDSMYSTFDRRLIITRDSNKNEMNTILKHITEKRKKNICVFYQGDQFGTSCLNNISECITDNNYPVNILFTGSYVSGTKFFYNEFKKMFNTLPHDDKNHIIHKIDAVILICTTIQKPNLIKYFKRVKPDLFIYTMSASGELHNFNKKDLNNDNIYYTDIIPNIYKKYPNACKTIHSEINKYNHTENNKIVLSNKLFIGWTVGKLIVGALEAIPQGTISRKTLIDSFYKKKDFQIDDYTFGPFIDNINNVGQKGISLYKYSVKNKKYEYIKTYKSVY
jgi:hypothetical protein